MTTKKQPSPVAAKTAKPAAPKKTAAEVRKLQQEQDKLLFDAFKVIVPLWFGISSVSKVVDGSQLRAECAVCLLLHGTNLLVKGESSIFACELALRPAGFDRAEAHYIALMGTSSLMGMKLAKYVKMSEYEKDTETARVALTAKGQKFFELSKNAILNKKK